MCLDMTKQEEFSFLRDAILNCSDCALRHPKHLPVPGVGPLDAEVMIVGEAPGRDEAEQGEPFVGSAGMLLNQCLQEAGLNRKDLFIANVVNCRPCVGSKDRPPAKKEIKACNHFLFDAIKIVQPKLVILLGNTPLSQFSRKTKITEMRGKPFEADGITYFPTYHPSFILRMPAYRQVFVDDLRRARGIIAGSALDPEEIPVAICRTPEEAKAWVAEAMQAEAVAIDTETTGLRPWGTDQKVLCVAVSFDEDKTFTVPMTDWGKEALRPLLESEDVKKVFHNAKFDCSFLSKHGLNCKRVVFDTSIAAFYMNENRSLKLEDLAVEMLGTKPWKAMVTFSDWVEGSNKTTAAVLEALGEGTIRVEDGFRLPDGTELTLAEAREITGIPCPGVDEFLSDPDFDVLMRYNGIDANLTLRLYRVLRPQLLKHEKFLNLFTRISMPLCSVLQDVERQGMMIDVPYVEKLAAAAEANLQQKMAEMNQAIPESLKAKAEQEYFSSLVEKYKRQVSTAKQAEKVGVDVETMATLRAEEYLAEHPFEYDFNWNSGDRLAELFFGDYGLGLREIKKSDTGKPCVDKETLKELAEQSDVAKRLLEYRAEHKLLTTYLRPWLEQRDENDRLHCSFNITGTKTGRLSSSDPNLQNIGRGKRVRNCFIAPPGWKLINADYSMLELRVAAQVAPEFTMRKAFSEGQDLHILTAAAITGKDPADITKEERTGAKAANFGLLYGMGTSGFVAYAKNNYGVRLTQAEAEMFRNRYFQLYPMLVDWHSRMRSITLKEKQAQTVFGRVRRFPDAASPDTGLRNAACRESTNHMVQSVAADIVMTALIRLHEILDPEEAVLFCTVHDSLMAYAREECAEMVAGVMKDIMENPPIEEWFGYKWSVPLVADVSIADRWGECK